MRRVRTLAVVVCLLVASQTRPARADVPVDDILASVAEVLKDRAKRAAARAIQHNIVDNLCSEKPRVIEIRKARLLVGGSPACFADPSNQEECTADDVFVHSCRLLRKNALSLADPHFLKTLGGDAVKFVFRVAGSSFSASLYSEYGLDKLAQTAFDLAAAILEDKPVAPAVAESLDEVASAVGKEFPRVVIQALRPSGTVLYRETRTQLVKGCDNVTGDAVCTQLTSNAEGWEIDLGANADQASCLAWRSKAAVRAATFESLYGRDKPYYAYREGTQCPANQPECIRGRLTYNLLDNAAKVTCAEHLDAADARSAMRQVAYIYAQLASYKAYLGDGPAKNALTKYVADVGALPLNGLPAEELANAIRILADVLRASHAAPEALHAWLQVLRGDVATMMAQLDSSTLDVAFNEFLRGPALSPPTCPKNNPSPDPACNATVGRLRASVKNLLVTPYLYVTASKDFELFRKRLQAAARLLDSMRAVKTGADLREVIRAAADMLELLGSNQAAALLGTFTSVRFDTAAKRVKEIKIQLEANIKVARQLKGSLGSAKDVDQLRALLSGAGPSKLLGPEYAAKLLGTGAPTQVEGLKRALADELERRLIKDGDVLEGFADFELVGDTRKATSDAVVILAKAIKELSIVIELLGEKDWVGLALHAADVLDENENVSNQVKPLGRTLKFVRVLMAMYQAESKDEAKTIFAAALDDEASREERFDRGAVDIAALIGFGIGAHWLDHDPMPEKSVEEFGLAGVYAPMGLQIAKRQWGILIYPIDLGSYLVASSSDDPTWSEAVRGGALVEFRCGKYMPIDVYLGGDYRPGFGDDIAQFRLMLGVGLELPLFGLN
jgi:hypothetical protein